MSTNDPPSSGLKEGRYIQLGINPPVSLTVPTPKDQRNALILQETMNRLHLYESEEGHRLRRHALKELESLLTKWVIGVALQQGYADHELRGQDLGLRILPFGSYKLGVVAPDGDIDICIVNANTFVTRPMFFDSFTEFLGRDPRTEKLVKVPEAYTPIFKFKFIGIDFDVLIADLTNPRVKTLLLKNELGNDMVLEGADDATVRCLNGVRVNQKILDLVPDKEQFRGALRLIKQWATVRGTYSNVLGYFGGITYAILVAQICQLFPYFNAAQLVCKFFKIYASWDWRIPVMLCPIEKDNLSPELQKLVVWSPNDMASKSHLMPILTPAFPSMNSTHNVSKTTKAVLLREFKRGHEICQKIENSEDCKIPNPVEGGPRTYWDELITPCDIFAEYESFIFIEAYAVTEDCFKDYCGFLESKLRLLVKRVETTLGVELRPWPEGINFTPSPELSSPINGILEGYQYGQARVIGVSVAPMIHSVQKSGTRHPFAANSPSGPTFNVNFRAELEQWTNVAKAWTPNKSTHKDEVNLRVVAKSRQELPSYCRHSIIFKNRNNESISTGPG